MTICDLKGAVEIIKEVQGKHLTEEKVKKITQEDRDAINKIMDFLNRYNGVCGLFYKLIDGISGGAPQEMKFEYDSTKGNFFEEGDRHQIEKDGRTFKMKNRRYDLLVDGTIKVPEPSLIGSFFKGLANLFGRVNSKTFISKLEQVNVKIIENAEDRYL